ncbi:hypothetical protein BaRGS_00036367 [Batillaria attramentaria]|uniref:Uncharacterized protein n=1 Tax=Batillaria attramentaria TaxID=370345 RepID=A0ABD0JC70_9CAEN
MKPVYLDHNCLVVSPVLFYTARLNVMQKVRRVIKRVDEAKATDVKQTIKQSLYVDVLSFAGESDKRGRKENEPVPDKMELITKLPLLLVLGYSYVQLVSGQVTEEVRPYALGTCERPWRRVLSTDQNGNVTFGSIEDVRNKALEAHAFRVMLNFVEGVTFVNVDNLNVRDDHVCAESLWHVTDNGTHVSTSAEWRFMLFCTTGQINIILSPYSRPVGWSLPVNAAPQERYNDAQANFGTISNETLPMDWYVKELGCESKPMYSHYLDGSRVSGSLRDLMYMSRISDIYVVMRDRGYSFRMNNVIVNEAEQEVNGQSLMHIGQRFADVALDFKLPPYYWFSSWTTDGRRDNSRWFVGTTQARGHNNDYVALDWYPDKCWRMVYENDQYGDALSGSLDELILMISLGHRVRVYYDGFNLEANLIRVADGVVIAQSQEEISRRGGNNYDKYFFNTESMWKWTTVHTTGTVRVVQVSVRQGKVMQKQSTSTTVRWMVDTRPWKRVLSTNSLGGVTHGGMGKLYQAVAAGASIRFNLQQDVSAGFLFTNADNVRIDAVTDIVYAQCLRHISDKKTANGEYEVQNVPFHWFLMISSEGVMTMSAWKIQQRVQLYDSVAPEANITWFASY